jgi:hypothetical protein
MQQGALQRDSTMVWTFIKARWFPWVGCVVMVCMAGCHRTPDETLIRQGIDAAKAAAQQADASMLAGQLSDDFAGDGELSDRSRLLGLLRVARFRGESIHALTGPLTIEPRGNRYIARFTVTLTSGGRLLPEQMGLYQVETAWRRDGRHWHCYSAHWTQPI